MNEEQQTCMDLTLIKKVGRVFVLLKWISVAPQVDEVVLAKLLGVSTRAIYRYIKDLKRVGIPIRRKSGGYVLENADLLGSIRLTDVGAATSQIGLEGMPDAYSLAARAPY